MDFLKEILMECVSFAVLQYPRWDFMAARDDI